MGRRRSKKKLGPGQPKEAVIQRDILNWLKRVGLLHWRQNSGVTFNGKRRIYLGPAGIPDIIVVIPKAGRFVGLEVKSANGEQRPVQVEFAAKLTEAGADYYVVRTLQQAKDAIAESLGKGGIEWSEPQSSRRRSAK